MSFPRYEACKQSGIEWLGEVPSHWAIDRLKWSIATSANGVWGADEQGDENDIPCVRVADFDRRSLTAKLIDPTVRNVLGKDRQGRVLQTNDLLLEKSGGGETQPVGQVVLYVDHQPAICSNFIARLVPSFGFDASFLRYLHAAAYAARINVRSIKQTSGIQNLDQTQYLDERVAYPSKNEQTAIAAFLDPETAKIDALIQEQQRLIELLKEKRQAVISHAVTKGLNPGTPMKDTGVEWLGQVPGHWSCVQLGRLCTQVSDGPHFSPRYVDEGVMFISARNIKVDGWFLHDAKYISEDDYAEFCRRVTPEIGDILYTKGGTTGIARVVDLKDRFQVWVHVAVIKLVKSMADPYYVAYALNSAACYEQSQLFTRGATNQDLGLTRMIKIWLALPPSDEQEAIVTHLNKQTHSLDQLIKEAETAITLLQERRSVLISAAVTGKIDVRGLGSLEAEAA